MNARSNKNTVLPGTAELDRMAARFAPVPIEVDISDLDHRERQSLRKLIEAARVIDNVFLEQLWAGNHQLYDQLKSDRSPLGKARLHLFRIYKSPWSDLDDHRSFLPAVPDRKPPGANFYPEDITREEFKHWLERLPSGHAKQATSFFTVIRRSASTGDLAIIPYHCEYRQSLERAASLLRDTASIATRASLKRFLETRAAAFLNDDYFESDIAWMDLDAPLDVTIGPYETYNDELFGYKAAFEAYVCLNDGTSSERFQNFSRHLQTVEDTLPIHPAYRNPKLGPATPIRVVNEIFSAGDGNHGIQTAAFNLPNDERVILQKGSKKVMLKNIQRAKFETTLLPISRILLAPDAQADVSFDSFFMHILAHEFSHGIGPHEINVGGRSTSVRLELKEIYSVIEEAKADVTGLFMIQLFFDRGILPGGVEQERRLYTTFLASAFRTLRFGITEAHARGMALQFNYFVDCDAFIPQVGGTFEVNHTIIKRAVRDLTRDLMTIEARGDYSAAQEMLRNLAVMRPAMAQAIESLEHVPTDIQPIFITADELTRSFE